MQVEIQHHEFNKNLFFYDLMSSSSISLCGCPVIFEEEIEVYKMANQILSFPGAYSQTKHLIAISIEKASA